MLSTKAQQAFINIWKQTFQGVLLRNELVIKRAEELITAYKAVYDDPLHDVNLIHYDYEENKQ